MAGLLDLLGGGGNAGGIDLNQLVRPPDPLGAALGEISQRLATAGQASRLPISTLGAIGSALGGASTAAQAQQTQYLDQAIKLQALKQSLVRAGYDQQTADFVSRRLAQLDAQRQAGGAPGTPAVPLGTPGNPLAAGGGSYAGAPGAPAAAPVTPDGSYNPMLGNPSGPSTPDGGFNPMLGNPSGPSTGASPGFAGFTPSNLPPGSPGTVTIDGKVYTRGAAAPLKTTGLFGDGSTADASGLDSVIGGAGAATTPASFRLASLVGSGSGTADPLGLIAKGGRSTANIVQKESGGDPYVGYGGVDLSSAPRDEYGFPKWSGREGPAGISHAAGKYQFQPATWREGAAALGIKDFSPESQDKVYAYTRAKYGDTPWQASAGGSGTPTGGTASPVSTLRGLLAGSDGGGSDPLAGLLALATGGGGRDEDPLAGLLKPQDEVIPSGGGLPAGLLRPATMTAPGPTEPAETTPIDPKSPENLAFTAGANAREGTIDQRVALRGVPGMPQSLDEIAGPGPRPGMMLAQYAPGGGPPAGSSAAAVEGMLGGAPSMVGRSAGVIPGLNMTPEELALLNTLSSLSGRTNPPFKDLLDLYYKSPEYLRQSEQEKAAGQRAVTEPSDIRIAQAKAVEDRVSKTLEQIGNARFSIAPNGILVPDGQGGMKRVQATVEQAVKAANGLPVPELGIQGMYPDTKGAQSQATGAAGTAPATGTGAAPQRSPIGEAVQTPAQAARDKAAQADFDTNVAAPFQAGQKALFPLTQIETAMQNYQTGSPTPETELGVKKALNFFADRLGLPADSALRPDPNSVASGEIIRKSGNALGFELARSLGAHEAENVVNQAIQSNPGLSVSPTGNTTLIALIKQGIQRDFDKHAFYNQWFDKRLPGAPGGTYIGADDAFNEQHPVESYVSQVLPYKANTKAEADKLPPGTRFIGPDNNIHIR